MLVLDSTALRAGLSLPLSEGLATTQSAMDEVRLGPEARMLDYLVEAGLKLLQPSAESIPRVEKAARECGDLARLSRTDVELLALALETGATLLTDDYSMQNTANILGVRWQGMKQRGITEVRKWKAVCSGCRRRFDEPVAECPVCGSEVRVGRKAVRGEKSK
ncbi:MAG: nucleic acid-binding protein [Euryarchaeota archaeon]|nr:nucleic acid-binding protein [Euryarchaeota archaeon]